MLNMKFKMLICWDYNKIELRAGFPSQMYPISMRLMGTDQCSIWRDHTSISLFFNAFHVGAQWDIGSSKRVGVV